MDINIDWKNRIRSISDTFRTNWALQMVISKHFSVKQIVFFSDFRTKSSMHCKISVLSTRTLQNRCNFLLRCCQRKIWTSISIAKNLYFRFLIVTDRFMALQVRFGHLSQSWPEILDFRESKKTFLYWSNHQ